MLNLLTTAQPNLGRIQYNRYLSSQSERIGLKVLQIIVLDFIRRSRCMLALHRIVDYCIEAELQITG